MTGFELLQIFRVSAWGFTCVFLRGGIGNLFSVCQLPEKFKASGLSWGCCSEAEVCV